MRIVTLNTWKCEGLYARRLVLMAEGLRELCADVICLQECFAGGGASTAASFAEALGMRAYAAPARCKLRAYGAGRLMSTSGLAILVRSPAISVNVCALNTDARDGQRIAQRLDLDHEGVGLRILNLHLTHLTGPAADGVRTAQLGAAMDWALAGHQGGVVVAGDLNATASDQALAPLRLAPSPGTFQGPRIGASPPAGMAIDHCVLVRQGGWRLAATGRALDRPDDDGWFPSDHAAVVLDLIRAQ